MKIKQRIPTVLSCLFISMMMLILSSCTWFMEDESATGKPKEGLYYETTLSFYVNPAEDTSAGMPIYGAYGDSVTQTIVMLLESEHFAQRVLEGLPNAPQKDEQGQMNPLYAETLKKIQEYTTFNNKDASNKDSIVQTNNIFYAHVSVKEDAEFAKNLVVRLQEEVVLFLEEVMPIPEPYTGTRCYCLSVNYTLEEVIYKA